jgi:DNA-binding transcriptional LysR family regulator
MSMDRLSVMQQFVRVVEAGSFSAAARLLGQGQPAISKAVAQLEDRLGVRLLVRTTRALTLTDAGHIFYDRARTALDAADDAEAAAKGEDAALSGRLRVCAPVTFARLHIVPKLDLFLTAHPDIALDLILDDRRIDLVEEGIDIALRAGALDDSSLTATRIAEGRRMVLATPDYFARHGTPTHPDALMAHKAIVYGDSVNWIFSSEGKTRLISLQPKMRVNAAEGQREAVLAHLGYAISSEWLFAGELQSGRVVSALPEWTLPGVDLWLLFPAGRRVSARARAFGEFLKSVVPALL